MDATLGEIEGLQPRRLPKRVITVLVLGRGGSITAASSAPGIGYAL